MLGCNILYANNRRRKCLNNVVMHLLPAKICKNMPIFAKIRIYRLVEKPNKIKGL